MPAVSSRLENLDASKHGISSRCLSSRSQLKTYMPYAPKVDLRPIEDENPLFEADFPLETTDVHGVSIHFPRFATCREALKSGLEAVDAYRQHQHGLGDAHLPSYEQL